MEHNHWYIPRQKQTLFDLVDALIIFNQHAIGKKWNMKTQLDVEDRLTEEGLIKNHERRSREANSGGGGIRTYYSWLRSLGFVFKNRDKTLQFTYAALDLLEGNMSLIEVVRDQLLKYQYPSFSSTSNKNSKVNEKFKVHPFWFLLKILSDDELKYCSQEEFYRIVIVEATSDTKACYKKVKKEIMNFRNNNDNVLSEDNEYKKLQLDGRSFISLLKSINMIEVNDKKIFLCDDVREYVKDIISNKPKFIKHHESEENFQRKFGCTSVHTKDCRSFLSDNKSLSVRFDEKILKEYIRIAKDRPISKLSDEIIQEIHNNTGLATNIIQNYLNKLVTTNNENVFYLNYINVAEQGKSGAKNFEVLTTTLFKEIFQSNAKHVGNLPKHPDVYLLDDILTGLIDNKSYHRNYSITNDHKNRMIQNYIPTFIDENNVHPLFFIYIASSLSNTTKKNIDSITDSTSVHGSAITANNLVQMAKLYSKDKISKYSIRDLFMSNKEIIYSDLIKYIN